MAEDHDPYRDPVLYDLEYEGLNEDIPYYTEIARSHAGPVLELGCGTGRISLALAAAGVHVEGLDASADMLRGLQTKLDRAEPAIRERVQYGLGDFTQLKGPARYELILLPFNAIHHCQSHRDVLRMFDGFRQALKPGGELAMDMYLPDPTLYKRKKGERFEERTFVDPRHGDHHLLTSWESGWYDDLQQVHHVQYIYRHPDQTEEIVHLRLRMYYPAEIRGLIDLAGWDITYEARDFRGRPVEPGSLKWVIRLRPRS